VTTHRPGEIALDVVEVRGARRAPAPPPVPWLFAAAMAASLAVSVLGGLVLGFLAAAQVGFGQSHWTEAVQAHGQLQLMGWVGVFVAALTFEFIVRLNQRETLPVWPRVLVLAGLGVGSVSGAAGQIWRGQVGFLWPAGAGLALAAGVAFAVIVFSVGAVQPLRREPQPLFFRVAAVWLVVALGLHVISVARADGTVVALPESRLEVEVVLRGFVLNTIIAVALRAFPGHLSLPLMTGRRQVVTLATINGGLLAWAGASGAFALPASRGVQQGADVVFAGGLILLTWWLGVLSPLRNPRRGPNYRVMVPLAWCGLIVYAGALGIAAVDGRVNYLSLYQQGGVRHIFLLGFMAPLMVAMAHVVLARFGTGHVAWEALLTAAFAVLMVAWPLRVVPALLSNSPGPAGRSLLGAAAVLTALALAGTAAVAAANAMGIRKMSRPRRSPAVR